MHDLTDKWNTELPDRRVLQCATAAAREKRTAALIEQANTQYRDNMLQQQIFYASLQSAMLQSPLHCAKLVHETLHVATRLSADPEQRKRRVRARAEEMRESAAQKALEVCATFTIGFRVGRWEQGRRARGQRSRRWRYVPVLI